MAVKTQAQLLAQVASLLADNTTGDISALDVRTCLNDIIDSASYGGKKVYKALLTQTGTSAPVATVLVNTLSGTPVWSRTGIGAYVLTLVGEFQANKTHIIINPFSETGVPSDGQMGAYRGNDDTITLVSRVLVQGGVVTWNDSDDMINNASITIEVYP